MFYTHFCIQLSLSTRDIRVGSKLLRLPQHGQKTPTSQTLCAVKRHVGHKVRDVLWEMEMCMAPRLSLIHIQMCIRDRYRRGKTLLMIEGTNGSQRITLKGVRKEDLFDTSRFRSVLLLEMTLLRLRNILCPALQVTEYYVQILRLRNIQTR